MYGLYLVYLWHYLSTSNQVSEVFQLLVRPASCILLKWSTLRCSEGVWGLYFSLQGTVSASSVYHIFFKMDTLDHQNNAPHLFPGHFCHGNPLTGLHEAVIYVYVYQDRRFHVTGPTFWVTVYGPWPLASNLLGPVGSSSNTFWPVFSSLSPAFFVILYLLCLAHVL